MCQTQDQETQQDATEWREGVPISTRFDDPYYSLDNGPAETAHVFLKGNNLAERMAAPLRIAELGFGTGLNVVMALKLWQEMGGAPLHITSFEAFPLPIDDMRQALAAFPDVATQSAQLITACAAKGAEITSQTTYNIAPNFTLEVIIGDARDTLPAWEGRADAWFLDGFSPAKNPELWGEDLMQAVFDHSADGATFATYTAAGHVRRALEAAGFTLERVPGFGRKRHMTIGRKSGAAPDDAIAT